MNYMLLLAGALLIDTIRCPFQRGVFVSCASVKNTKQPPRCVSHYSNLTRCNLTACVSRIQEANPLPCDVVFTYLHAADGMCIISNGQRVRLMYSMYVPMQLLPALCVCVYFLERNNHMSERKPHVSCWLLANGHSLRAPRIL